MAEAALFLWALMEALVFVKFFLNPVFEIAKIFVVVYYER